MKKILLTLILFIVSFGMIYMPVKADSGWDSDYDSGDWNSGSSWDSDSDWDSGSNWDYSSGSSYSSGSYSSGGSLPSAIVIAAIIVIVAVIISKNKPNGGSGSKNISKASNNYKDIDVSKITSIDPDLNIADLKTMAFNTYRDLQTAWMNFDTDTIRKLTTDEIYNMYSSQLETLKLKKQKNMMTDITLEDAKIIDIKKENNVITLSVYLRVKCYDYVIKEATGETVRGKDEQKINIEYVLSFVKSATNINKEEKCPNCGAPVEINSSATCPYCNSTLVKESSTFVMSKKTCVGQSLDR